jgi:Putative restriction endonuclease
MASSAVQVERRLLTVDEYEQMVRAGVFNEDDRLELIEGELITGSPIGSIHAGLVNRLTRLLTAQAGTDAIVSVQNPIRRRARSHSLTSPCCVRGMTITPTPTRSRTTSCW